jgi:hypothetical protein
MASIPKIVHVITLHWDKGEKGLGTRQTLMFDSAFQLHITAENNIYIFTTSITHTTGKYNLPTFLAG